MFGWFRGFTVVLTGTMSNEKVWMLWSRGQSVGCLLVKLLTVFLSQDMKWSIDLASTCLYYGTTHQVDDLVNCISVNYSSNY